MLGTNTCMYIASHLHNFSLKKKCVESLLTLCLLEAGAFNFDFVSSSPQILVTVINLMIGLLSANLDLLSLSNLNH